MPLFATRIATGSESAPPPPGPGGAEMLGSYWTPDDGYVFSVFAGGDTAPPAFPVLPITSEEYGPPDVEPAAGEGEQLGLVLVKRQLDPLTHSEFRAIALQAIMCAHEYSDLRWLRSYWAQESNQLYCLFRTRTHELVREHARRSRIPCDEVHDAVQLAP